MWAHRSLVRLAVTLGAAGLGLCAASANAGSANVAHKPICTHAVRPGTIIQVDLAQRPMDVERVIVGLIGAGTSAWNATLGGIIPAPELAFRMKAEQSKAPTAHA